MELEIQNIAAERAISAVPIERGPLTLIPGAVEYAFYLSGDWPNELGSHPDDLIGRNVRYGASYFRVVSRKGERYLVEPLSHLD